MERLFYFLTDLSSMGAYAVVFIILLACGLGLPLPEDIPLVASGYLIWDQTFSPIPTLLVTMIGVLVGDFMLFSLGRRLGLRYLYQGANGKPLFKPRRVQRARAYFRMYGDKIVFFARFLVGFRSIVFFMAGAMKMKASRFLFLDALAALISVPAWILLGYMLGRYFGDEISVLLSHLKDLKHLVSLVIVVVLLLGIARLYYKYRQNENQKGKIAPPRSDVRGEVSEGKPSAPMVLHPESQAPVEVPPLTATNEAGKKTKPQE
jgi:membrane protein DedA with SNARE-associated domain